MTNLGLDVTCPALRDPSDTSWLLLCGVLVMTMQGGFALLESGSVRINNTVNIVVKNIFDMALAGVGYWALGWGFAYGRSVGGFIGVDGFFPDEGLDHAMWFFQFSFASTATTIDSGACCERMHLAVYFGLSLLMTCWTYPLVSNWVWSPEGWLLKLGYIDLAGASVVHALGGSSALVCTLHLGPRMGKLGRPVPPELQCVRKQLELSHEVFAGEPVHVLFGSMMLFFAWVGFNAGSSLGVHGGGHLMAANVAYTTVIGGSFGTVVGSCVGYYRYRIVSPSVIATSMLSGLVGVTGSAHVISGWQAAVLGSAASIAAVLSMALLERYKVDDPVGVVPVHLVGAVVGTLGTGIFAHTKPCINARHSALEGLAYSGSLQLLGIQLLGLSVICLWSMAWTQAYLVFVARVLKMDIRVNSVQEMVGNDVIEHGIDVFKQLKHTQAMQEMMGKLAPANPEARVDRVDGVSSPRAVPVATNKTHAATRQVSSNKVAPMRHESGDKLKSKVDDGAATS